MKSSSSSGLGKGFISSSNYPDRKLWNISYAPEALLPSIRETEREGDSFNPHNAQVKNDWK
jgi:hypothetical protein